MSMVKELRAIRDRRDGISKNARGERGYGFYITPSYSKVERESRRSYNIWNANHPGM